MLKFTIVSIILTVIYLTSCTTPSQKREPAQVSATASDDEINNAIKKTKATRHQGMAHVAHAHRAFTPVQEEEQENEKSANPHACGDERWDVKTLTDSAAVQGATAFANNLMQIMKGPPTDTLLSLIDPKKNPKPAPWTPTMARMASESQIQKITAQIIEYKRETDHDYHIVITDPNDPAQQTMIVESPDPDCPGGISPNLVPIPTVYKNIFTQVRTDFDTLISHHNGPMPVAQLFKVEPPIKVFVTGFPFFDKLHGQTGVAQNGIELHPILDLEEDPQAP